MLARAARLLPMAALAALVACARGDIVLLDECWVPEIQVGDVGVVEADAVEMGDPSLAKSGEISARLQNVTGAPSVRFRAAAHTRLDQVPPDDSEARLWYRTDAWNGTWRFQVWSYTHTSEMPPPVLTLEARLDGGGPGGRLIADDEWHLARGILRKAPDWESLPHDRPLTTFLWLSPEGGWDTPHITYVDRAEIVIVDGPLKGTTAPEAARRVRPHRGRHATGEGWVWLEGEDADEHNVPPGGALAPDNAEQQALLSNGAWLQHHGDTDWTASWEFEVDVAGRYDLWVRSMGYDFRWALDRAEWQARTEQTPAAQWILMRTQDIYPLDFAWVSLGQVQLNAGKHTLRAAFAEEGERALAIDCWLLATPPLGPNGTDYPGEPTFHEPDPTTLAWP